MGLAYLVVAAVTAAASYSQNQQAQKAQKNAQSEQSAVNKAQQADEMRRQIREERIKRARILQASEASGTTGSSGEFGAISSLSTQLAANTGSNQNMIDRGSAISQFQQNAADAAGRAQAWSALGSLAGSAVKVGNNIFNQPSQSQDLQGPLINQTFPNNLG